MSVRERIAAKIAARIEELFPALRHSVVGLYWPIRAELDARGLATRLISHGARIGLPVVVERNQPLEFWAWKPGDAMERGDWNIPVPAVRETVHPGYLIVPVVGFDDACYRLGYGGGYYDRTLAAMSPRPTTIGIGPECARLDTIYPQPHDIPMDVIVTEKIVRNRRDPTEDDDPNERRSYASPPCFMHEVAGEGVGAMTRNQTIRLLNELLEAERAGARGITAIAGGYEVPDRHLLKEVAVDEGRFVPCSAATSHGLAACRAARPAPSTTSWSAWNPAPNRPRCSTAASGGWFASWRRRSPCSTTRNCAPTWSTC